ncbi:MAG: response regulator transcription factor [Bacteroidetes bacterium]|jgi:DNA-binding NarL/FixJ family response regulator|nr:response regulator transcription factor [Bacteroidota bacterium]
MKNQLEKKLLIVDDSPIIIERLLDSLKDHETVKTITTAPDYRSALQLLQEDTPHFVLLDIHLPDKSGIDLLKLIVKEYPLVKVIMFSNLLDEKYIKVCRKIGAKYFIDKSRDFEQIPGMLNNMT